MWWISPNFRLEVDYIMKKVKVKTGQAWRRWLIDNHDVEDEVWLVFYKKHTGVETVSYEDTVEQALCFGWIDSIIKRLDDDRYARKFTPRRPGSRWSESNKKRAEKMIQAGMMTGAGLALIEKAKSSGEWHQEHPRPDLSATDLPQEFSQALADNPAANDHFAALAPSYQRQYILWIGTAKQAATRRRRTAEAIEKLQRGEKLGLK
ncbi:hypothetical protein GF407_02245 [candidate division KSB1 bacterium]|nr:hypothetical protein [candidate division KSB1 bacterium]